MLLLLLPLLLSDLPTDQGPTDAKTIGAIQAAFVEASRFAPTLLLLTHLPALMPSGAAAAGPTAGAALLQTTETLASCIRQYSSTAARQAVLPWLQQHRQYDRSSTLSAQSAIMSSSSSSKRVDGLGPMDGSSNTPPVREGETKEGPAGGSSSTVHDGAATSSQDAAAAVARRQQQQQQPGLVVTVGLCESLEDLPAELAHCFTHHVEAAALERQQYVGLLAAMVAPLQQQQQQQQEVVQDGGGGTIAAAAPTAGSQLDDISLAAAAGQMVGLLPADVAGVVADAAAAAAAAASGDQPPPAAGHTSSSTDSRDNGNGSSSSSTPPLLPVVSRHHLDAALGNVKSRTATEIGAPQVSQG
jgi:hypothetical protein